QPPAVGAEVEADDGVGVAQDEELTAGAGVPEAGRAVVRAAGEQAAVGTEGDAAHRPLVAVEGEQAVVPAAAGGPGGGARVAGPAAQPLPDPLGVVGGPGGVGQQRVADRQGLAPGGAADLDLVQRLVGVAAGGGLGDGLRVGAALLADGGVALADGLAV